MSNVLQRVPVEDSRVRIAFPTSLIYEFAKNLLEADPVSKVVLMPGADFDPANNAIDLPNRATSRVEDLLREHKLPYSFPELA